MKEKGRRGQQRVHRVQRRARDTPEAHRKRQNALKVPECIERTHQGRQKTMFNQVCVQSHSFRLLGAIQLWYGHKLRP